MTEAEITKLIKDSLFVAMCLIYLKLIIAFMASLAPQPKRKRRGGRWWQEDEVRGK